MLRWPQLDALWERVTDRAEGWYIYELDRPAPEEPAATRELRKFVETIDKRLRREHEYDYCGIVYADDLKEPDMVKVYDPGNLGAVCGSSGTRVLPRWVLSRIKPESLNGERDVADGGRSWWQRLFGG